MNEQTENNKRTNFSLKFYSKTHKFTVKNNSRNTDWIVALFPQVKSA